MHDVFQTALSTIAAETAGAARPSPARLSPVSTAADGDLMEAARAFEAAFLAEMLAHTGLGQMRESLNGGPGEAAFAGQLLQEYAADMARRGGLGLADAIAASLRMRAGS